MEYSDILTLFHPVAYIPAIPNNQSIIVCLICDANGTMQVVYAYLGIRTEGTDFYFAGSYCPHGIDY